MTSPVSIPAGRKLLAADFDAYENATAAWATWASTLTNLTVGSGTLVTKYRQVGKTVDWRFRFIFGSGSAVGTAPQFTLPVTPHADYAIPYYGMGHGALLDAATTTRFAFLSMPTTNGTVVIEYLNATPAGTQITATAPWTWTTSDQISAWGTYEAA